MLPSIASSLLFLVVPLTLLQRCSTADSNTSYSNPGYKDCSSMTGNSSGSGGNLYQLTLRQFLAALPSNAINNSGFFNGTMGSTAGGTVFGMAMCQADIPWPDQCRSCLEAASAQAPMACPSSSNALVSYQGCVLRYSDVPILAVPHWDTVADNYVFYTVISAASVPDTATFGQTRKDLFSALASAAAVSPLMIASGNRTFNGTHNLYGLAQCYREAPREFCSYWLTSIVDATIPHAMPDSQWSEGLSIALFGAYIRYDLRPFGVYVPPTGDDGHPGPGTTNGGLLMKVGIPILAILIVMVVALTFGHYRNKYKIAQMQKVSGLQEFSYGAIKTGTMNFANKLGQGAFGSVFKGTFTIKKEKKELAVKCIKDHATRKQMLDEAQKLANLNHTNVVRLHGFCDNDGWLWFGTRGRGFYICMDFMPKGSLDKHIFENPSGQLAWPVRCRIMRGICVGLQYLHGLSNNNIAHMDLKPSNILLDEHMEPKIADFGISRNFVNAKTHTYTYKTVGTNGYMAPELTKINDKRNKYKVGFRCDIYSLGVLILAIVMGRGPEGVADPNGITFIRGIRDNTGMQLRRDAYLRDGDSLEEVENCIKLALECLDEDPEKRPLLEDIFSRLPNPRPCYNTSERPWGEE